MGYARTIQQKARTLLGLDSGAAFADKKSFDEIKGAITEAYHATADEIIFHKYVRRYGFSSLSDFRENSYKQLGDKITSRISEKIEKFDLGMELLVYGFDEMSRARFIHIHGNDIADQSVVNAWAIGSGTFLAFGSMHSKEWIDQSIESLIYRACEAKFCAEYADAVGKSTSAYIWYLTGMFFVITTEYINKLRVIWEASRWSPIPADAADVIRTALRRDIEFRSRSDMRQLANCGNSGANGTNQPA